LLDAFFVVIYNVTNSTRTYLIMEQNKIEQDSFEFKTF
jgi:hypothetical protein